MSWTRQLRLKHLQLLIELSESGSLSDVARSSHSTQPSLSKWLKELEDDIGAPLFERHARGLRPTALGDLMVAHARRMLSEVQRTEQDLHSVMQGGNRILAVGTSPAAAPSFVPAAIMQFLRQQPRARIRVEEGTMNQMLEQLELGKLDLVVGRMDNYKPRPTLRSAILYDERLKVVARPDHPLTHKSSLSWEDLYQYEWIVWPDGTPIRSKLDNSLTAAGQKPAPLRVESSSQIANLWMIKYSDMLSISSERVARHFTERGLVVPLDMDIEHAEGNVGICWRDEAATDALLNELLDCFSQQANHLDEY
ncbi:LysR substrate-binding domain-containing protein [Oceanobacter mangrovi]|uniref:LysR substrate-binding domain-containing protein n=1 Tax=Oceanobacter mangrovi TaxID=2862510 RepID=UPI001C8D2205|nr:LysR substrate-binding domain-containing protein [Oceanobacter mangrovi]